jgi:hypothetical protein
VIDVDAYKEEVANAIAHARYLKFDKKHPWHRNLVALYCSLIEYSDSLIFLSDKEKSIGVPVIFRGLLEAYVEFKNLAEDKAYGHHMEASYSKEWLKVIQEASKQQNDFLADIAQDPLLEGQIREHKEKLEKLKANGYSPLTQFGKFDRAGMADEYRSIYNFVCAHSHNNIRALIDRFFLIDEKAGDFELALFRGVEPGEHEHYLITGRHFLRNASRNIHALLRTGYEANFTG